MKWWRDVPQNESGPVVPLLERMNLSGTLGKKNRQDVDSPLVQEAMKFAHLLSPPKPPQPAKAPQPVINKRPVVRPPKATARFRLLATSCNRSHPDKSFALVSEPGKGAYWIKKHERLGHFVIEKIKKGALVYRDGTQLRELTITAKQVIQLAKLRSEEPMSSP
jgi:hypothetical protein